MLSPETVLQGRYRIVRQLGQGGMGAVYEAVDLRLDTVVALKETLFTDEKLRKQFEREARLLARLHHQALPRVSDHFNEGDGQFLVMQFIPGEDLFEMQSRRNGAFPQADVLRWADQLCDALDYLHTQDPQIIHRDIKPQNLKLTARGQVVLLDFGLAKGSGGMSVVTTSASIFGYTPNYAPLEQIQGLGTDSRSDIYSLAATLYHLLTNTKPPDALSRASAIVNGLPDPLAPADSVSPQVSRAVASVLERAMSQKRDERYSSAEEMREALRVAATLPAGEAATVLNTAGLSTRANTVAPAAGTLMGGARTNVFGNEAKTLVTDDSTRVRAQSSATETATVIRPASTSGRSRKWLTAVAAVLVLAGIATAVLIRRSLQSKAASPPIVQNPVPAEPTPTPAGESVQSVTVERRTENPKTENSKTENTNQHTKQPVKVEPKSTPNISRDPIIDRHPQLPEPPGEPMRNPPDRQPPPRDQTRVQNFPNGTRLETRPDGTRIVTFPDGRTRVFPPGVPLSRRRRPN
jgi:serine/threonine protein kinase